MYVNESFRVSIPDNWSEFAQNPVTLGPAGAFRLNNGRPELTHGLMIGVAQPATSNLQEISDRFVEALMKGNPRMRKQGDSTASTIGGVNALTVVLIGSGIAERTEIVTVHTALLSGSRFFYAISVAPEAEINDFREAFNKAVGSIQFVN
jgi:hypothetical protein